jgi:prepilin-type N-terminal cleavage/methylation domain-containing protein
MKSFPNRWADKAESGKRKAEKIFQTERGFSLIELIGVLAVMAILASMTVPPILRQIRQAQSGNEEANLNEVARAIVEGIKATGTIPNPNIVPANPGGWVKVAEKYTTLTSDTAGPGTLHYVSPKEVNYGPTARRIYLDNKLMEYLKIATGSGDGAEIPFITPAGGWPTSTPAPGNIAFPNQALLLYIVSSSRPDFELSCRVNQANLQVANNSYGEVPAPGLITSLRNWVKAVNQATGFIYAPDVLVENWNDLGHQYLHVKTVDLRPLFCRVELIEYPLPQNAITTSPGIGYTALTAYNGISSAGFVFEFTTPAGSTTYPAGTAGTYKSGKGMIKRGGLIAVNDTGTIPIPGGASANFSASVSSIAPYRPWWEISPYTLAVDAQQMPIASNTQDFYVLKGTTLSLYADSNNRPASPILSVQINADCSFEYFNGSWTRVD